jgi:hypothetical protein
MYLGLKNKNQNKKDHDSFFLSPVSPPFLFVIPFDHPSLPPSPITTTTTTTTITSTTPTCNNDDSLPLGVEVMADCWAVKDSFQSMTPETTATTKTATRHLPSVVPLLTTTPVPRPPSFKTMASATTAAAAGTPTTAAAAAATEAVVATDTESSQQQSQPIPQQQASSSSSSSSSGCFLVLPRRSVLHVQSLSKWAPLCIGPYSQVNGGDWLIDGDGGW